MIEVSFFHTFLIVCLSGILVYIAFLDFLYYQIPNILLLLILLLFLVWVLISGQFFLLKNIRFALVFIIAGMALSHFNIVGEGDTKLLAVLSLWFEAKETLHLLLLMSLIGGVLSLVILFFGKYVHKARQVLWDIMCIRKVNSFLISNIKESERAITLEVYKKMVPYGIAIAVAGICCLFTKG